MTNQIKKVEEKNITDVVLNKVINLQSQGAIDFPQNYSVANALKSAYLILQDAKTRDKQPVLQVCTQGSIVNSLLDMVVQGLNPSKQQCYFIPYGNQLQLSRSYLGTIALTKRLKGVKDVVGYAVYKDDVLEWEFDILSGKMKINKFVPAKVRQSKDLIGALAIILGEKEPLHFEYMDMEQIKNAWNQGQMKGKSGAHINFPDQMAIKTVINRACKKFVNTADDSDKIIEAFNRSMDNTDVELEEDIRLNANTKELLIDYEEITAEDLEVIEEVETVEASKEEKAPF